MNACIRSALIFFLLAPAAGFATTWGDKEVDDPIAAGSTCKVHEPVSYGSYIYNWPSKYDQVFWPFTDPDGIWHCEKSGFTALIGDFSHITPPEKDAISRYLQANYHGSAPIDDQLRLLAGIYELRHKDDAFNNHLFRVLARWYQELGQSDRAAAYRRRALLGMQQSLKGQIPEGQRLEYLYLAANYTRFFGDTQASDRYIEELHAAVKHLKDGKLAGFAEYLSQLVKETPRIKPGKILDPGKD